MKILIVLLIVFGLWYLMNNNREGFDLDVDLVQKSYIGRFIDRDLIGVTNTNGLERCKHTCNNMESCKGISYKLDNSECRLYNGNSRMVPDPRYVSWRPFGSQIY